MVEARVLQVNDVAALQADEVMVLLQLGIETRRRAGMASLGQETEGNQCSQDAIDRHAGELGQARMDGVEDLVGGWVVTAVQHRLEHGAPLHGDGQPTLAVGVLKARNSLFFLGRSHIPEMINYTGRYKYSSSFGMVLGWRGIPKNAREDKSAWLECSAAQQREEISSRGKGEEDRVMRAATAERPVIKAARGITHCGAEETMKLHPFGCQPVEDRRLDIWIPVSLKERVVVIVAEEQQDVGRRDGVGLRGSETPPARRTG